MSQLRFPLLGRELTAQVNGAVGRWLCDYWRFESSLATSPYRIYLEEARAYPHAQARHGLPQREVRLQDERFMALGEDGFFVIGDDARGLSLELGEGEAFISMWGLEDAANKSFFFALYLLLIEAVRASGLMALHASAAAKEEAVRLFLGPSGRGKTSTLLNAVRLGWAPISEDLVWLEPETLKLYGWDRQLRLLPDSLRFLGPRLAERDWGELHFDKYVVPYEVLEAAFGVERSSGAALTHLTLLERDASVPSALSPLAPRQAALALWEASGIPLVKRTQLAFAQEIPRILKRVDCQTLTLGASELPL